MTTNSSLLFKEVTLRGFLSFGPHSKPVGLRPLNVLIGPNGSGKSNFIEALSILKAVPRDLPVPIRQGGGVRDWIWKGTPPADDATVEVVFPGGVIGKPSVRYRLKFGAAGDRFIVLDERIEDETPAPGKKKRYVYFGYDKGRPMLNIRGKGQRTLKREDIDPTQSILSQRRDPESYPEVTQVGDLLRQIVVYRHWSFGPDSPLRASCPPDVFTGHLAEDFSNLPARLAVLKREPRVKQRMVELLLEFCSDFRDLEIVPEGGQLQLYVQEAERMVPARRLSDGTLRYLSLVAILVDPDPPRLIAIEEPELGLHPDILPTIRDLLVDASARCQLVVSTHSTQLVDAMTDDADCVVVCEKQDGNTCLTRLDQEEIERWREQGSLGNLWMSGHLGGTRW